MTRKRAKRASRKRSGTRHAESVTDAVFGLPRTPAESYRSRRSLVILGMLAQAIARMRAARAARRLKNRSKPMVESATLAKSGKKLADSAVKLEVSTGRIEDSADRRTELAADRTLFAAERTYNAWVRTGLLALASGIGAKALLTGLVPDWLILANGSVLVLFSMFCFGAAVWRQLNPGLPPPIPTSPRISPALLIAINGFLALVSLFALFGVWFDRLPAP